MSKGAVISDYFATRKRGRFNQEDALLKKQPQITTPPAKSVKIIITNKTDASAKVPVEATITSRSTRASSRLKSDKVEELKDRIAAFDDKLKSVKATSGPKKRATKKLPDADVPSAPIEEPKAMAVEAPKAPLAAPKMTKAAKMAELRLKIQQFNIALAVNAEAEPDKVTEPTKTVAATKMPAYMKFSDLASANIDHTCTLTLPRHYAQLLDAFKGSETIIKFLNNRQEVCTFLKLKMAIQNITRHTFTLIHLSQIKTVYPQAYLFKQEKMFIDFKNDYHLIIMPNMEEIEPNAETGIKEFSPHVLLMRLNKFKTNIFNLVKDFHQKFLASIGITNIDGKDLKRWHPKFDMDNLIEIEQAELPKPPNDSLKCKTGKDLLNIAKEVYSNRIKEAIESVAVDDTPVKPVVNVQPVAIQTENMSKDEAHMAKLKEKKAATYSSLLEKIKLKEKTKAIETMIINSDKEKQLTRFGQVKAAIRFITFFFTAEKKSTLELDKCADKMSENLNRDLDAIECKQLITEIADEARFFGATGQKWLNLIKVRGLVYLKMDKAFEFNELDNKCQTIIDELKLQK